MLYYYYKDLHYFTTVLNYEVVEDNCNTKYEEFSVILQRKDGTKKTLEYIFDYDLEMYLEREEWEEEHKEEEEEEEFKETPDDNWWIDSQMEEMIINNYGWD